jgi:hypothetical protein
MPFWKKNKSVSNSTECADRPEVPIREARNACESSEGDAKTTERCHWGMFILEDKSADAAKVVDIVAIHGLNGHYQRTWSVTAASGEQINWLKDFLPKQIPNARIMSYGYSSAVQFSKSVAGIETFAEQLLEDLMSWRNSLAEQARPIVFICHSLGGIVFKQVKQHPNIQVRDGYI